MRPDNHCNAFVLIMLVETRFRIVRSELNQEYMLIFKNSERALLSERSAIWDARSDSSEISTHKNVLADPAVSIKLLAPSQLALSTFMKPVEACQFW